MRRSRPKTIFYLQHYELWCCLCHTSDPSHKNTKPISLTLMLQRTRRVAASRERACNLSLRVFVLSRSHKKFYIFSILGDFSEFSMGKRKRSHLDDDEYKCIKKKVKKLERMLRKCRRQSPSDSASSDSEGREGASYRFYGGESNEEFREVQEENVLQKEGEIIETEEPVLEQMTIPAAQDKPEEILDPEILMILGEDPSVQKEHGEDLHTDIAARWSHILMNGLSKEIKSDLLKIYLPAENCSNMKAPKLNLEIEAALSPLNVKKDIFSKNKQNQISSCLSAIGMALNWALSSTNVLPHAEKIIKPLSDAGRLLCDSHYRESQSRRYAIINSLNKKTQDAVRNTKLDETLFGANLVDHLKSSKAISQSGAEMKYSAVQRATYKPPPSTRKPQRGALNSRGMSRPAVGEPRQYPNSRKPAAAPQDHRRDTYRRSQSTRQKTSRR